MEGAFARVAALRSNLPASLSPSLDRIAADYVEAVGRLRASVMTASAASAAYPISGAQWFDGATRGIDVVAAALETAGGAQRAVAEEASSAASEQLTIAVVLTILSLAAALATGWTVLIRVLRPLAQMTGCMGRMADGDFTVNVPGSGRRDEIGAMAGAMEVFRQHGQENQRLKSEQERQREAAERAKRQALQGMADTVETETRTAVDKQIGRASCRERE